MNRWRKMSYAEIQALPKVGFWKPLGNTTRDPYYDFLNEDAKASPFPAVETTIDPSWTGPERDIVLAHVKAGDNVAQYRGISGCRVCGKWNGSCDFSDGTYVWPEGFAHYIEAHAVKPPQEFIDHCLRSAKR